MTGDLLLDWSKFQQRSVSPAKAFEAFSAQLFERWVRREYGDNLQFYALHGAGGDGGVEAFATLADGAVIGLQAKWFPGNLDSSRVSQIWCSITTARTRHPNLVRYVVTMPTNLTLGGPAPKRGEKKGRAPKGGVERWQELVDRVTATYSGLILERWDEQGLRRQLDLEANHELYAAWFSGIFLSFSELHLIWEKARGRLRDRYLPDLHATGAIEEALIPDLFEPSWVNSARCDVADAGIKLARPPYEPRGPHWPELDVDEARDHSFSGGKIVTRDLSWYVADHCFSPFHSERREYPIEQGEDLLASVDKDIFDAVLAGQLPMPAEIVQRCRAMVEQRNQQTQQSEMESDNLLQTLRELYAQEVTEQGEPLAPLDGKGLLRWAMERHSGEDTAHARKPQRSDELRALYTHASQVAGVANIAPAAVRNALIAAKVRSWGWSEISFCCYERDKLPERVDQAIVKRHGAGASHGSRSAVATFREKYVWAAVNCVAGELADRLPVWDDMTGSWRRLDRLEQLGTGMPDPLPRSAPDSPPVSATEHPLWLPDELWPELFADEALVRRAERWLSEAPLPNPRAFVRGCIESWQDATVLAASLFHRGHQGCIDQAVWVATMGVPIAVAELFKRDLLHRGFTHLHKEFVGLGDAVYTSPVLACWAPWFTREGEAQTYISLDHTGQPVEVTQYPLVTSVMAWDEDEHPREPNAWSPAPVLRSVIGIVGAVGDRHLRQYIDRSYRPVAIERDVPHEGWSFDHHYLGIAFHSFADACATVGLVPMWVVRLWREATPALWMKDHDRNIPEGLMHRSRDTHWLLSWNEQANDFDVVLLQDILKPWVSERDDRKRR